MTLDDTIIARATAGGAARRGIIRLSGKLALEVLYTCFLVEGVEPLEQVPEEPHIFQGAILPWGADRPVPAKLFFWPQGRGYTGQQTVEIHTLGSEPVLDAILSMLLNHPGLRMAEPGEFTMRAFLAGRLDLTRAEAVLGVIDAKDTNSLETALNQLAGNIAIPLKEVRNQLLETLAHFEAGLDFPDEEIEFISNQEVQSALRHAYEEVERLTHRLEQRGISGRFPRVVLVGPPNAGKSTLFNALLGADRAIVSSRPGTTRDFIEAETRFGTEKCVLVDTAGFDPFEPIDSIDAQARSRARQYAEQGDLLLRCHDTDLFEEQTPQRDTRIINIRTKTDLAVPDRSHRADLAVSARSQDSIDALKNLIAARLSHTAQEVDIVPETLQRCRGSLIQAKNALQAALDMITEQECLFDEAVLAADLRTAVNALGIIDGSIHTEDLLDSIFSRFCIGK